MKIPFFSQINIKEHPRNDEVRISVSSTKRFRTKMSSSRSPHYSIRHLQGNDIGGPHLLVVPFLAVSFRFKILTMLRIKIKFVIIVVVIMRRVRRGRGFRGRNKTVDEPMKDGVVAIDSKVQTSWSCETQRSGLENRSHALVGTGDLVCGGVLHVVAGGRVALGREEENVFAVHVGQRWGFDVWTIAGDVGEDLSRSTHKSVAVRCDFLQHDRGWNDWLDSVAARSTMADSVSIDLVDDVAGMAILLVREACDIDSTALGSRADPRLAAGVNKGVIGVLRGGETKAV